MRWLPCLLIVLGVEPGMSQPTPLPFHRLSTDEGLSSNVVRALIQDQQGFIWVGTNEGIDVYDGYSFTKYPLDLTDSLHTLIENIAELYEDRSGMIWAGSRGGLLKINPPTGSITPFFHDPHDPASLSHNNVFALVETEPGILWIGTEQGLNRLNTETGDLVRYEHDPRRENSLCSNLITALTVDAQGTLWLGTQEGLCRFDPDTNGFTHFVADEDNLFSSPHNFVRSLIADTAHTLWVGTQRGLSALDLETLQFTRTATPFDAMFPEKNGRIITLRLDAAGALWVGSDGGGLATLNLTTKTWTLQKLQPDQRRNASNESVRTILEDRTGLRWVGLWDRGLYKETSLKPFITYAYNHDAPGYTLSSPIVTAIHPSTRSEIIWIGTYGGLDALHPGTGHIEHFQSDPDNTHTLSYDEIWDLEESRDGALWVATMGGGLNRMDPARKTFKRFLKQSDWPGSISSNHLHSVLEDAAGTIWIGTVDRGLNRLAWPDEAFTVYLPDTTTRAPSHYAIWPLLEDREGLLWIGTIGGGLNRYDPAEERFVSYMYDPDDSTSISGNVVQSIYEDDAGDLWIGTMGRGLNRYDRAEDRFYRYTTEDGLPHNTVTCVTGGRGAERWISTLNGLARLDLRTQQIIRFNKNDGLPSNTFRENACAEAPDGTLYFGSEDGLVAFRPEQILPDQQAPAVVLTGLDLFNEPITADSTLSYKKHVRLAYNQNVLTFHFSALHFAAPAENEYAYRLEGVDKGWHFVGSDRRSVTYANLAPGGYVFRVKASNSDGIWNDEGASVRLVISPPWWQTWPAFGLYLLLFGVMTAGYVRWWQGRRERRRLQEHNAHLAELDKVKSHLFADISHEFRTPLTLIMGPLQDLLGGRHGALSPLLRKQHEMMLRNSRRLQRLINQLLDLARLEAGRIELQARLQDLPAFVRNTVQPFTPLAESEQITLVLPDPAEPCLVYFDLDALEKVLANLLSNALKFTPSGGTVTVTVQQRGAGVEMAVRDTGPGIPEEERTRIFDRFHQISAEDHLKRPYEGSGLGLALAKGLVALHGGTISVESVVGQGSTFRVQLPLGKAHLHPHQIIEKDLASTPAASDSMALPPKEQTRSPSPPPASPDANPAEQGEDVTTLLIVDDNADIRSYLRSILEPSYAVLEAANGVDGLACARSALPDLIVADVMMPEMDGFALLRALQADPATDNIPVVLLTARVGPEDEQEGFETGAVGYVTKPFDADVLRARVQSLIAFRQRLRERLRHAPVVVADPPVPDPEPALAREARCLILEHLHDAQGFTVVDLADALHLSYSWMHHRFTNELSMTPTQFIRTTRVERAAALLDEKAGTISEVAYAVGFNSLSYFTKSFRERFGLNPSDYLRRRS